MLGFGALWALAACATTGEGPVSAPSGWSEQVDDGTRVLRKGAARITIGPWESLGEASLRDWLVARAPTVEPVGGQITEHGEIKAEERFDGWSVTRRARLAEGDGQSVVVACPGQPGVGRLLHLAVPNTELGAMLQAGMFMERVCLREPKGSVAEARPTVEGPGGAAPPPPTPAPASEAAVPSGPLSPGRPPPGLKDLRGVITMGMQAGGMFGTTETFIATFDDGTYTEDLQHAFGEGLEASRRAEPRDWGHWRTKWGELQLKGTRDDAFDDTRGSWVAREGKTDQRLSGCFGRITSTSGADYTSGTTVGLASSWCFWPDGRFTHNATAFGSASDPSGVVSATKPTARGRYRIDGYVARFVYDDGHEVVAAFCFANEKRNHVMLNGRRFMGR